MSAIARQSAAGAGTARRPASRATTRSRRSRSSSAASSPRRRDAAARALSPERARPRRQAGRAVVVRDRARQLRERTGARAGHAGTLDPFATGLLLVLLGASTKAGAALRRARQALRDGVDLTRDDVDRRPRGRGRRASTSRRARDELEARLDGAARRGRPADPGRVGGEDRRRARVQAAPARRRGRDADAADDGPRARARRLRRTPIARSRPARQLGRLRARDRRGARRPLREPAPHGGRARSTSATRPIPERIVPPRVERLRPSGGCARRDVRG